MVVRNTDVSREDEQTTFDGGIFFYRAKVDHREFTIGCDEMWRYHYRHYNEHYESDEEDKAASTSLAQLGVTREAPKKKSEIEVSLRSRGTAGNHGQVITKKN